MTLCLDVSNWDRSTFDADCLKGQGVESIILGCQDPVAAEWMAAEAVRADIRIRATYGMNYFTPGPNIGNGDIHDCIDISRHYGVRRTYIDCEIDAAPDDVADRNSEVADCESLVITAGLQPGIYTAPWWWVPNHGNTQAFAHLPLWFSNFGANDGALPPIRYLGFLSFGGWTECEMHQYTSTMWLCGRKRDANYVFEDGDDEMGMTAEEKAAFAKLLGEHEQLVRWTGLTPEKVAEMEKRGLLNMVDRLTRDESNDGPIGVRLSALEARPTYGGVGDELADGDVVRITRVKG